MRKETALCHAHASTRQHHAGLSTAAQQKHTAETYQEISEAVSACNMPCYQPRRAWKVHGVSKIILGNEPPRNHRDAQPLGVACQECIGCQQTNARNWAFRCQLELADHDAAVFTTLTLDNTDLHPTLSVTLAQKFLKRLREKHSRGPTANRLLRYFLAGEYGTYNKRPHYHAIIYGAAAATHGQLIQETWGLGFTYTTGVTPETIAYVAGYTAKKAKWKNNTLIHERVNPNTGEIYEQQPEFFLMSRRPGIGATARQHTNSWRDKAIYDGLEMPVPRYYAEAWKKENTPIDWHVLKAEKTLAREKREKNGNYAQARIDAAELIANRKATLNRERRSL